MKSINEIPAKRRKLCSSLSHNGYDSQNDSGDEIFEAYDTVETVPLPRKQTQQSTWIATPHVTQPTQIIHRGSDQEIGSADRESSPIVQVKASSPTTSPITSPSHTPQKPRPLPLNTIAPAGTVFRAPPGIYKAPPATMPAKAIINISDDDSGPVYQGGSSDEESQLMKADIKPSSFVAKAPKSNQYSSTERFKNITLNAMYDPNQTKKPGKTVIPVRSSDMMANAYGDRGRKSGNLSTTADSAPVVPVESKPTVDIPLFSIPDYQMRDKIKRMQSVLPSKSVLQCKDALLNRRNNYDDAMEYLLVQEESKTIDLTINDDNTPTNMEDQGQSQVIKKNKAKQHIKAPIKKIHEKWTFTKQRTEPASSPSQKQESKVSPVPKSRRRLVQGRKRAPPPDTPSSRATSTPRFTTPESEDFDSGLGEGLRETRLESQVLEFFNTCSGSDLADIATISLETAQSLLAKRPFPSLNEIRQVSDQPLKDTKVRNAKLVGDKFVDKCLEMWAGYEAVDKLVRRCKDLAQPLQAAMSKWGVDVYGLASKNGEIEIVDIDDLSSGGKDSGIGTPSSRSVSTDEDFESNTPKTVSTRKPIFFGQPSNMAGDVMLKDYQIVGMNWLSLLFEQGQRHTHDFGAILADDMGLGKTCQVVAFLAHLMEKGIDGPHLVIVPGSTLENWLREFRNFCPKLSVRPYYAGQNERPEIREEIERDQGAVNVVITTYTIAKMKDDNKFLRRLNPVSCIYDEGHMLRNSKAAGYEAYMRISTKFRLLLTGTPLQNNLRELVSLLGFILPSVFREHSGDLEVIFSHKAKTTDVNDSHAALLSTQRISRAKSMMAPFVLRRKKYQVLKQLPAKHRRVEYCDMSKSQIDLYKAQKAKAHQVFAKRKAGESTGNESANILMALRKASLHPLLFRRLYDDDTLIRMAKACVREDEFRDSDIDLVYEDMAVMDDIELHQFCERYPMSMSKFALQEDQWMDSGKVKALEELLKTFKANGDRVLVFSQFVMVMNILELVMETLKIQFFRLDGQTKIQERQSMIDEFEGDPEITVFLLSTKAGGAGINLTCANKVIIFDSSFNPQDDIQAENRAHRVGQTRDVEVVRLVTKDTIEEQILALGETKLALDARVADSTNQADGIKAENQGKKMVEEMLITNMA